MEMFGSVVLGLGLKYTEAPWIGTNPLKAESGLERNRWVRRGDHPIGVLGIFIVEASYPGIGPVESFSIERRPGADEILSNGPENPGVGTPGKRLYSVGLSWSVSRDDFGDLFAGVRSLGQAGGLGAPSSSSSGGVAVGT